MDKYRQMIDQLPLGVAVTSVAGQILVMNPAGARLFGYDDVREMRDVTMLDLYADLDERQLLLDELSENDQAQMVLHMVVGDEVVEFEVMSVLLRNERQDLILTGFWKA